MKKRVSGILLHITSLPSRFGVGDFGPQAYHFVDFLCKAGQSCWQILPLTPPHPAGAYSPYNCLSAFAGNTLLISPELLYKAGLLGKNDIKIGGEFPPEKVDFEKAARLKKVMLDKAAEKFKTAADKNEFQRFCSHNRDWLDDYALFTALTEHFKTSDWSKWPRQISHRQAGETDAIKKELQCQIENEKILQFLFFTQWLSLKKYCNDRAVTIIGDVPLYVAHHSADAWAHREVFRLSRDGKPVFVSGVPPDFFSRTGQLWGNPVYDWPRLKTTGYHWWMRRIGQNLRLYDAIRIDHFIGLVRYWQVPAAHSTAEKGRWKPGPGEKFFDALFRHFPAAAIIVEDLGCITTDVRQLVKKLGLPCMKVLLFAFEDARGQNPYLPHNHIENCIVYTGTHDNNTIRGWFENDAAAKQKQILFSYLGRKISPHKLPWELLRMAMGSVANTVILPVQDILALGSNARMNNPANSRGNWQWRLVPGQLTARLARKLAAITQLYARD